MTNEIPNTNTADESAVRELYQQALDGWNRGSAKAFGAPFTEDAQFVAFDGTHFKNREAMVAFHQPLFDKWLKGTRLVGQVQSVRFLAPDVALMHAVGDTIMRGQSKASPARHSIQTMVAVQADGVWKLTAFQNTRVRRMGPDIGSFVWWTIADWFWKLLPR